MLFGSSASCDFEVNWILDVSEVWHTLYCERNPEIEMRRKLILKNAVKPSRHLGFLEKRNGDILSQRWLTNLNKTILMLFITRIHRLFAPRVSLSKKFSFTQAFRWETFKLDYCLLWIWCRMVSQFRQYEILVTIIWFFQGNLLVVRAPQLWALGIAWP